MGTNRCVTHLCPSKEFSDRTDLRRAIYDRVRRRGWQLRELRRDVRTLEATFTELVASTNGDTPASDAEEGA